MSTLDIVSHMLVKLRQAGQVPLVITLGKTQRNSLATYANYRSRGHKKELLGLPVVWHNNTSVIMITTEEDLINEHA